MAFPKIANVQCSHLRFEPGDRIIVRVCSDLDRDQKRKLLRSVQKWAGTDVEVLLVDLRRFDVEIEKAGGIAK